MQCIAGTRQDFQLGGSEGLRRKRYGSLVCDALPIRGVGATRQARGWMRGRTKSRDGDFRFITEIKHAYLKL